MPHILVRIIYYFGYKVVKIYWFIFRPKAFGVKCVVQCGEEMLLIRNSYGESGWTFPGGGVESGETPEQAARRELKEEVNIVTENLIPLGNFLTTKEYKRDLVHCFATTVDKKAISIDNTEVVEAAWFHTSEMPPLTDSGMHTYNLLGNI